VRTVDPRHLFEQVARRARHDGAEQRLVVRVRSEHQTCGRWLDRVAHVTTDRDALAVGQANVEDGDVRAQRGDAGEGLGGRSGLADDLDVVLALQELGDTSPDDLVVVEQEHGDGHSSDGSDAHVSCPGDQVPDRSGP
jgi:hypothetical protein